MELNHLYRPLYGLRADVTLQIELVREDLNLQPFGSKPNALPIVLRTNKTGATRIELATGGFKVHFQYQHRTHPYKH